MLIDMFLAGKAAEELILNFASTTVMGDISHATNMAREMITNYAFGKKISTAKNEKELNNEINEIIENEYQKVTLFLIQHKALLLKIAEELLKKNVLSKEEIQKIIITYENTNNLTLEYQ